MLCSVISLYVVLVLVEFCTSKPMNHPITETLPKCCPKKQQISGDGKACVEDESKSVAYRIDDGVTNLLPDVLPISVDNKTVFYKLDYTTQFNCVRHEVYLIQDDIEVAADGSVVVFDDDGESWTLTRDEVCVDSVRDADVQGLGSGRVFVALLCPSCSRLSCLHKCCPESQHLQLSDDGVQADCITSSGKSWSQEFHEDSSKRRFVFHGIPECNHSPYLTYPEGPLEVSELGHLRAGRMELPRGQYCGDSSARGSAILACRQPPPALRPTLYGSLFCLGAGFLALTLALHLWLPELRRSLHSRVLVAHVVCLLVAYITLAVVNLARLPTPSPACSATAFIIQFSILAAIFWLNVMCVDIAWTFSGKPPHASHANRGRTRSAASLPLPRNSSAFGLAFSIHTSAYGLTLPYHQNIGLRAPKASLTLDSDGHKFLYYSLYAWGSTAVISGVTAFLEFSPTVPEMSRFKPSFGTISCWFKHWETILLLVYGPMGVLLLMNVVLFIYTAYKIKCTQQDAANMVQHAGSKLRENKDRFTLYLKLFGLMGVTWVFEIVSYFVGGPASYWYLTDIINALRSVFIFALFCLKRKVYALLKSKLLSDKESKFPKHSRKCPSSSKMTSSMTSQRTTSIQLSQIS